MARVDDQALYQAVRAVHQLFMATSDRVAGDLAALGLTYATATALWAIEPDQHAPSMKALAERLFCHAPNLSFVVGQLESRGLVERLVDQVDRRSRTVALTPAGLSVRAEVIRVTLAASPLAVLDTPQLRAVTALLEPALHQETELGQGAAGSSASLPEP